MIDAPPSPEPEDFARHMLRRLDGKLDRVIAERAEDRAALIRVGESLANTRKELALIGEHLAHFEVRFDDLKQSVDRINVRLDLVSG